MIHVYIAYSQNNVIFMKNVEYLVSTLDECHCINHNVNWLFFIIVLGVINATAANIKTKSYAPPPPPTIRDSFNPKLTDTLYDTDNLFQEEWLTGKCQ